MSKNRSTKKNRKAIRKAAQRRWTTAFAVVAVLWSGTTLSLEAGPLTFGPVTVEVSYHHG